MPEIRPRFLYDAEMAARPGPLARLPDHRLAFVAEGFTLVASPGATVMGVLDVQPESASIPVRVLVDSEQVHAVAVCRPGPEVPPDRATVDAMVAAAGTVGLPPEAVAILAAFRPGTVLFATHNAHKREEVAEILGRSGITVVGLDTIGFTEDPPEDGDTFIDNALQKARFVFDRTGLVTVADDSGIAVDALGGAPGVMSRRFTPEATPKANNALLLAVMAGRADRRAQFRCAIALVTPWGEATAEAHCEGTVAQALRGDGGFGYDPLFLPDETPGRTMAELTPAEKHAISHRGRAFALLPDLIAGLGR